MKRKSTSFPGAYQIYTNFWAIWFIQNLQNTLQSRFWYPTNDVWIVYYGFQVFVVEWNLWIKLQSLSFSESRLYDFFLVRRTHYWIYPRIFDTPCLQVKSKFTHKLSILWSVTKITSRLNRNFPIYQAAKMGQGSLLAIKYRSVDLLEPLKVLKMGTQCAYNVTLGVFMQLLFKWKAIIITYSEYLFVVSSMQYTYVVFYCFLWLVSLFHILSRLINGAIFGDELLNI